MNLATNEVLITTIKTGGVAIIPTDTLYGLVGQARNPQTVEQIYQIKGRNPDKPVIILISSLEQLTLFEIVIDSQTRTLLDKLWPGEVSVILPCPEQSFTYLHRGTHTLAFRLPNNKDVRDLIAITGPLIAPSANPEGLPPATTMTEARNYFGDQVDYYPPTVEIKTGEPSTLVAIEDGRVMIKRQGRAIIPNDLLAWSITTILKK